MQNIEVGEVAKGMTVSKTKAAVSLSLAAVIGAVLGWWFTSAAAKKRAAAAAKKNEDALNALIARIEAAESATSNPKAEALKAVNAELAKTAPAKA